MEKPHHDYNKSLKAFARNHRNNSTRAEIKLWTDLLRNKQMMGYAFLRQRSIGNYIADFFCKQLKLVIETDGYSHQLEEVAAHDELRTEHLTSMGYHVLRFEDDEVMNDLENVRRTIEAWIEAHKQG